MNKRTAPGFNGRGRSETKNFEHKPAKETIAGLEEGDYFKGTVKILRKAKPGPVIFLVSDGEASVDAVTKDSHFKEDDVVFISGSVSERAGRLQIEISSIETSEMDFDSIIEKKSIPLRTEFSIPSERFDKMKARFIEIAQRIRKAIFNGQPILIRHHNDCDGISSGLAIDMACRKLMDKLGINPDYNLYRSPSKAPFYDSGDVFRDLVLSKRLTEGHGQKKPLIIVSDNGSTPEDEFGMKTMKSLGHEIIVIDHHNPVIISNGKTAVCPYLKLHLNPYMFGLDSKTCAGMLCYEIARMVNEEFDMPIIPAVAAISDRCDIPETEHYIANSGKGREELTSIGTSMDFISYQLKFDSGKGVFDEVYSQPAFVEMITKEVKKGVETQLQSTLPYLRTQEINGVIFSHIDLEKYTLRFAYPTPGRVVGLIHDRIAEGKEHPVLTIGHVSDMIIIRATHPVLPVQRIIEHLKKELPAANVDGGGHEQAGTIKFVSAHLTTIIESIKNQLKNRKVD